MIPPGLITIHSAAASTFGTGTGLVPNAEKDTLLMFAGNIDFNWLTYSQARRGARGAGGGAVGCRQGWRDQAGRRKVKEGTLPSRAPQGVRQRAFIKFGHKEGFDITDGYVNRVNGHRRASCRSMPFLAQLRRLLGDARKRSRPEPRRRHDARAPPPRPRSYDESMRHSVFCLAVAGGGWGQRLISGAPPRPTLPPPPSPEPDPHTRSTSLRPPQPSCPGASPSW